jgi:hypothetical protein
MLAPAAVAALFGAVSAVFAVFAGSAPVGSGAGGVTHIRADHQSDHQRQYRKDEPFSFFGMHGAIRGRQYSTEEQGSGFRGQGSGHSRRTNAGPSAALRMTVF